MTPKSPDSLATINKRKVTPKSRLDERLSQRGLVPGLYKWCKEKDVRHVIHINEREGGCCSVCTKSQFMNIEIRLDCNYEPTNLLQELEMDLSQEPQEMHLPEGLRIGHIVVPPGSIILAPRYHRGSIVNLKGQCVVEVPIRCGTVEEILYNLYYYYSPRLSGEECERRWMKGLLKVSECLYTPNIC